MNNRLITIAKKSLTLLVILGSGIALTGCGKKAATPTGRTIDTKTPITLTIWRAIDDNTVFNSAIENYTSTHANVKINVVKKDMADYENQSLNALAEGIGPDIWSIPNTWLPRHYKKLVPVPDNFFGTTSNTDFYKKTWVPLAADENIIANKVYGIPLFMDTLGLYVNNGKWNEARDVYRKANADNPNFDDVLFRKAPETWNDLLDELPFLTKKDNKGNIVQPGIAIGTSNNVPFAADILSLLMLQNGTKMTDDSQKAARFNTYVTDANNNPVYSGTNALDFYTSFARADKSNYSWNSGQPDALQNFIDGKLPILIGYQYYTQVLKQQAPTLDYNVFSMPQVKGAKTPINYGSYWTETVTNNSRHSDVAWDFLASLGTRPQSYISATRRPLALIQDPQQINTSDPFDGQPLTATSWHKGKYPEQIDDVFKGLIDNVTNKKQPLQSSLDAAATNVTTLLQKE